MNLENDGVCVVEQCIPEQTIRSLLNSLRAESGNTRDGFSFPAIVAVAESENIRHLITSVLGKEPFAIRAIIFNKNPELNWRVSWHQDCFVAVKQRVDASGWGPWSTKAGITHVRPPADVLSEMLTIRIHLDHCGMNNGPLRVQLGSHKCGVLSDAEIESLPKDKEAVLSVKRGDAIFDATADRACVFGSRRPFSKKSGSPGIRGPRPARRS